MPQRGEVDLRCRGGKGDAQDRPRLQRSKEGAALIGGQVHHREGEGPHLRGEQGGGVGAGHRGGNAAHHRRGEDTNLRRGGGDRGRESAAERLTQIRSMNCIFLSFCPLEDRICLQVREKNKLIKVGEEIL